MYIVAILFCISKLHFCHTDFEDKDVTQILPIGSENKLLQPRDFTILFEKLSKYSDKWITIGLHLGFLQSELDNIQARPLLLIDAPNSWLRAMLSEWLQWAPADGRGSDNFATLDDLSKALVKSELQDLAQSLLQQYNNM